MSDHIERRIASTTAERTPRGQSVVEFALVLPMLVVLALGLADFGRVFSAGITIEAAARNAAEAVAQEYLQLSRNKTDGVLAPADYDHLRDVGLSAVCSEAQTLPNTTESGGGCTMPLAWVCVHDGSDPGCIPTIGGMPAECDELLGGWSNANAGPQPDPATPPLAYVEVRVCYRFSTIYGDVALPLGWDIDLGEFYLERERHFTVADY